MDLIGVIQIPKNQYIVCIADTPKHKIEAPSIPVYTPNKNYDKIHLPYFS